MGRVGGGGGLVVSVLPFNSSNPSLNPDEFTVLFCKMPFEKNENKQKEACVGQLKTTYYNNLPQNLLRLAFAPKNQSQH